MKQPMKRQARSSPLTFPFSSSEAVHTHSRDPCEASSSSYVSKTSPYLCKKSHQKIATTIKKGKNGFNKKKNSSSITFTGIQRSKQGSHYQVSLTISNLCVPLSKVHHSVTNCTVKKKKWNYQLPSEDLKQRRIQKSNANGLRWRCKALLKN